MQATYPGADAKTLQQAVSTPIEQQMNGVDNMLYMYSVNANNGQATVYVDFDVKTNPDTDQVLAQLRVSQAQAQLPAQVNTAGLTVLKSLTSPLMLVSLSSPDERVRPRLSHQLRHHQPAGRVDARARRVAHSGLRRPVRDARLGEAGPAGASSASPRPKSSTLCRRRTT